MQEVKETISLYEIKKKDTDFERKKITSSEGAKNFIRQFYGDDIEVYESFFILLLDMSLHTIGYAKISQGGITGTVVDKKIVFKYIIDSLASAVIIAHNHPSGNLNPSTQDIEVTKKIREMCLLTDSYLSDHIILTKDSFYSFTDNGI